LKAIERTLSAALHGLRDKNLVYKNVGTSDEDTSV
jgi:hypothetical protein